MNGFKRNISLSKNNKPINTKGFIELIEQFWKGDFRFERTEYNTQYQPTFLECEKHGYIKITPKYIFRYNHPCRQCSIELIRKQHLENLLKKAIKIHGNKYDYNRVVFINQSSPVEIICPKHGSFFQTLNAHVSAKAGCKQCAIENDRWTINDFLIKAKKVHGDLYDYSKVQSVMSTGYVTIICKEHGEFSQRANSHTAGNGCMKCFLQYKLRSNTNDFVEKAKSKHGSKYDYSKVSYVTNRTKVEIICPKHGSFFQTPFSHLINFNSCPKCRESNGERTLSTMLEKLNIEHVQEYRIKGYKFSYDFYVESLDTLIEFHGIQHYKSVEAFGGLNNLKATKKRDKAKIQLAKEQNLNLIVLNYNDLNKGRLFKKLKSELKRLGANV